MLLKFTVSLKNALVLHYIIKLKGLNINKVPI